MGRTVPTPAADGPSALVDAVVRIVLEVVDAAELPGGQRICAVGIAEAGGVDLQVLGIGADGHIAFNEPGSSLASRTRLDGLVPQVVNPSLTTSVPRVVTHRWWTRPMCRDTTHEDGGWT